MIKTPQRLKKATNYLEFRLPKARAKVVECHSRHEFLYLLLSDADRSISEVESQPVRIGSAAGKYYIPDVRVKIEGRDRYVEVKSKHALETAIPRLEPLLANYTRSKGATYAFVDHESLDANEVAALQSLKVSRWALQYRDQKVGDLAIRIHEVCQAADETTINQLICHFEQSPSQDVMGAICLLVHEGRLQIKNPSSNLDRQTKVAVAACEPSASRDASLWRGK